MRFDPVTQTIVLSIVAIVGFLLVCIFLIARDYSRKQQRQLDVCEERISDAGNEVREARTKVEKTYQEYARQSVVMQEKYANAIDGIVKEMRTMSYSFRRALDHLPPSPSGEED